MKQLLAILMIAFAVYVGKAIYKEYASIKKKDFAYEEKQAPVAAAPASTLPGMPENLEASYQNAHKLGAAAIRNWLVAYQGSVRDPRLADIELDYVILVSRQDPAEAKRVFQGVKARVGTSSPVYSRIKKLDSTFQ